MQTALVAFWVAGISRSQDFRLQSLRNWIPKVFFAKLSGNICRTVAVAILVQTGVVLRVGDGTWMNPWMKPYWDQCLNSGEQSFSPFRRYLQPEKMQEKCVVSFFFRKKKLFYGKMRILDRGWHWNHDRPGCDSMEHQCHKCGPGIGQTRYQKGETKLLLTFCPLNGGWKICQAFLISNHHFFCVLKFDWSYTCRVWKNKHPKSDRWILNSAWFLNCSKVVGPCGIHE